MAWVYHLSYLSVFLYFFPFFNLGLFSHYKSISSSQGEKSNSLPLSPSPFGACSSAQGCRLVTCCTGREAVQLPGGTRRRKAQSRLTCILHLAAMLILMSFSVFIGSVRIFLFVCLFVFKGMTRRRPFFKIFIYLFVFCLLYIFVAALGLSLFATSRSSVAVLRLIVMASLVAEHRL